MMRQPGDRVGAILEADTETVKLLGFGVYEGEEIPPPNIEKHMFCPGIPNPKILLDNGEIVWGCQCWFASEEKVKAMIGNRRVVEARIEVEADKNEGEGCGA